VSIETVRVRGRGHGWSEGASSQVGGTLRCMKGG
jgi:hypothetical protein